MNEEMYEEEDDDLPIQYRLIAAHLRGQNMEFNQRLSAYLQNEVAMRSGVYQQNNQQFASMSTLPPTMFPTPMTSQQQQMIQQGNQLQLQQQMLQMQTFQQFQQRSQQQTSSMHRQAPYNHSSSQQSFQAKPHSRSASIATPQELMASPLLSPVLQGDASRRSSLPLTLPIKSESPTQINSPASTSSSSPTKRPSFPPGSFSQGYTTQQFRLSSSQLQGPLLGMDSFNNSSFPLSTSLSGQSQGLLGSTINQNDPLGLALMAGSNNLPGNFYNFNAQDQVFPLMSNPSAITSTDTLGKQETDQTIEGLSSTLAPSTLRKDMELTPNFFGEAINAHENRLETPSGNNEWSSFFDEAAWEASETTRL